MELDTIYTSQKLVHRYQLISETLRQPLASSHALISNRVTESVRTERLKFLKKRPLLIRGAFSLIK